MPKFIDTYDKLFGFQKEGVAFLTSKNKALLADDMGVGKTPQAIVSAQHIGADQILVVCPASVKYNWLRECVKWGYLAKDVFICDSKNAAQAKGHAIVIVNYDIAYRQPVAKHLVRIKWDLLICDEAHYLKNKKAKRTKAVFATGGYSHLALNSWFLTGTPVLNRPVELYTMLKSMCPKRLGRHIDYIQFTKQYCNGHEGNWGWDATGASNIDELSGLLDGFMLRRERDILKDLPSCMLHKVYMPRTNQIEKILFTDSEDSESIRKKLSLAKVKDTAQYIKDVLESEKKVVIFGYHVDALIELSKKLIDYNPQLVYGATSISAREDKIKSFIEKDRCRVFIGQINAIGTGVNGLQESCNYVVFSEISYVPGENTQAIGRVHRHGQKHKVVVDFLLVEGSMDEAIVDKVTGKEEVIKQIVKDKDVKIKFNEKNSEENKMSIEDKIEKLTIAVEKLTEVVASKGGECRLEYTQEAVEAPVDPTPAKPKKTRKKKAKAEVVEAVVEPTVELDYDEFIKTVSKKINTEAQDPANVLVEFNKMFKATFPNHAHVFSVVEPSERLKVVQIINQFLQEKGLA